MYYLLSSIIFLLLILPASCFAATTTYVYDELDRLQEVVLENGTHISYEYDKIGNIVTKKPVGNNVASITSTASNGGTIYPSGVLSITFGGSKMYAITPSPGYKISNVYVDGTPQGEISSYSFSSISANHTISVIFNVDTSSCANSFVRIARSTPTYYSSLQSAYDAAVDGETIQAVAIDFAENLTANTAKTVTLDGGYMCGFASNPDMTNIIGAPRINNGTMIMKNIHIK